MWPDVLLRRGTADHRTICSATSSMRRKYQSSTKRRAAAAMILVKSIGDRRGILPEHAAGVPKLNYQCVAFLQERDHRITDLPAVRHYSRPHVIVGRIRIGDLLPCCTSAGFLTPRLTVPVQTAAVTSPRAPHLAKAIPTPDRHPQYSTCSIKRAQSPLSNCDCVAVPGSVGEYQIV